MLVKLFASRDLRVTVVTRTQNRKTMIYDNDDGDDDYEYYDNSITIGDTHDVMTRHSCGAYLYIIMY